MSRIRRVNSLVIHSYTEAMVRRARAEAGFSAILCWVAVMLNAAGVPVAPLGLAFVGAICIGRYLRLSREIDE